MNTTDSSIRIYEGKYSDWKLERSLPVVSTNYTEITGIAIRRKPPTAVFIGMGAGAAIAIPFMAASTVVDEIRGTGSAGKRFATVGIGAVSGAILGAIVGSTYRRHFAINNNFQSFQRFRMTAGR